MNAQHPRGRSVELGRKAGAIKRRIDLQSRHSQLRANRLPRLGAVKQRSAQQQQCGAAVQNRKNSSLSYYDDF